MGAEKLNVVVGPGGPVEWGLPLPAHFRPTASERCIELPLALATAVWFPRVLDAGAALNILDLQSWVPSRFTHVTLGKEKRHAHARRQYVTADLRALPFADRAFSCVTCVSTLEHVGMDNRHYGHEGGVDPASVWTAVRELWRVCAGAIVISVPYGVHEIHPSGQWQAFGPAEIQRLIREIQPALVSVTYYAKEDGWRLAGPEIGQRRAWRNEKTVTGLAVFRGVHGSSSLGG